MSTDKPKPVFVPAARKREIADLADAIAEEYCPVGKTEPETIAKAKEITLSFGSYGDAFDGMLEHLAGKFHIYCAISTVSARQTPQGLASPSAMSLRTSTSTNTETP
jgi:hypothetical protein